MSAPPPSAPTFTRLPARVAALGTLLRPTPVLALEVDGRTAHAKLELHNPFGSLKDRPAYWILKRAIERGDVDEGTTIIESSSGNFATALAGYCRLLGLSFIPVIDPNINAHAESGLRASCERVVKVDVRDDTGGYLKTRLATVQQLLRETPQSHWTNQYGNPDGAEAHERFTGAELVEQVPRLDAVFIGVSSAGTIAGVSRAVKRRFPKAKVVAVDVKGSVIFGGPPKRRHIPGIGASIRPELLGQAQVDEVVVVSERETALACRRLLDRHGLFVGGSSGSVFAALEQCARDFAPGAQLAFICADRGTPYLSTVFDADWCARLE